MKDNYTYPTILDYSEEGFINIIIPAFHVISCVRADDDPIRAAQEVLALNIKYHEDEHKPLPDEQQSVAVEEGQKLVYINLWMPYHRNTIKETYVKKTLTIPAWLDILAKQSNLNFSATLVEGLKRKLSL